MAGRQSAHDAQNAVPTHQNGGAGGAFAVLTRAWAGQGLGSPWPKQVLEALPSLYISGPWKCTTTPAGNVQHQAGGGQWPVSMRSFKTAMSKQSMLQAKALLLGNELGLGAGHRTYCFVASALASCSRPKAQALSSSGPRPPRKMYNIGTPRYILATAPRTCNYPHLRTGRVIVHWLGGGLAWSKSVDRQPCTASSCP